MKKAQILTVCLFLFGCTSVNSEEVVMKNFYDFKADSIDGTNVSMSEYKGKVVLVVNTASRCGYTKQYAGLQKLYTDYKDKGFVILGFPCNDFMHQEPGSNEKIKEFCKLKYGVEFPMFAKITVKGKEQLPLYAWLTSKETDPEFAGNISWNFNKFLISKEGKIIGRFGSKVKPQDEKLISAIENALK